MEAVAMSQKSPLGFGFGVLIEIAAVVAIVAVLPRIDLRPPAAAQAATMHVEAIPADAPAANAPISQVNWTALDLRNGEATRAVPYYEPVQTTTVNTPAVGSFGPSSSSPATIPPPTINVPDPKYVEQRLDRVSQQLVNTVGSAVSSAGSQWTQVQKPAGGQSAAPRQKPSGSTAQVRPWLRY
jgi:hypothetical protein